MERTWQTLGAVAPADLAAARLQLHYAVQLAAAVGNSIAEARPDYSHTSLEWVSGVDALAGVPVAGERTFRTALRPRDLTLLLLDESNTPIADHMLNGQTFASSLDWLRRQISAFGGDGAKVVPPTYQPGEFPTHPLAEGQAFSLDPAAAAELGGYYANADLLLDEMAANAEGASAVRIWPHHFDIATLISLDEAGGETARSIGVGLSPGDDSYAQPYFYVTAWPAPPTDNLPALPLGEWHTLGWVGAILTAEAWLAGGAEEWQGERARKFISAAVLACRQMLEGTQNG